MKVAVTAQGRAPDSPVDQRFGRAAFLVIADLDDGRRETLDNLAAAGSPHEAGLQTARVLADRGVGAVITGHCGPKAFKALAAAGIRVMLGASGRVEDALECFKRGELREAREGDVANHWI